MKKSLLMILVFSFSSSAFCMADMSSDYLVDAEKLQADMHKVELTLNGQIGPQERDGIEKLKWRLDDIRSNLSAYNDTENLNEVLTLAIDKNWGQVLVVLEKIKSICQDTTVSADDCFIELASFDDFINTRNMSEANKLLIKSKVNAHSKHLEARIILNDKFFKETDISMAQYKNVLSGPEAPLMTVKFVPAQSAPLVAVQKIAALKMPNIPEVQSAFSIQWGAVVSAILIGLGFAVNIVRKRVRAKRDIRDFYGRIFFKVRKNTYKTKIFGKIRIGNSRKAVKIQNEYLNFVSTIDSLKANVDIRFKNKDEKLVIETLVYTSSPIQEYMKTDETKIISKTISDLESRVFALGGEVSISNLIDHSGKIVNSSITLIV